MFALSDRAAVAGPGASDIHKCHRRVAQRPNSLALGPRSANVYHARRGPSANLPVPPYVERLPLSADRDASL